MKTRQRSFPLDQLSIVFGNRSVIIEVHGSDILLVASDRNGTHTVAKRSPNQLFEMISKLVEEKEV